MSHEATNWAIKQRGLKPSAKIVLWHLCDRYNPDFGCFPSQERLAESCEIGRSTLNRLLKDLEESGHIYREKRFDKDTKRQKSTRYILGFEDCFAQYVESRVPNRDMGAVSHFEPKPCPISDQSRVPNRDTNLVRLTSKRTSKIDFCVFWEKWPNKVSKSNAERAWRKLNYSEQSEAASSAPLWFQTWRKLNPQASPIHAASYLNQKRWTDEPGDQNQANDIDRWKKMAGTAK